MSSPFRSGRGIYLSDDEGFGDNIPQVSRLIGKFRDELDRGLRAADAPGRRNSFDSLSSDSDRYLDGDRHGRDRYGGHVTDSDDDIQDIPVMTSGGSLHGEQQRFSYGSNRVNKFRNRLNHLSDDVDSVDSDDIYGDDFRSGTWTVGGAHLTDSIRRRRQRDKTSHGNFGNAASIRQDLENVISDFKKLPARLNAQNYSENETKGRQSTALALVPAGRIEPEFCEDDIVEAVRRTKSRSSSSSSKRKEWCEGRVDRVTRHGTFDIRFNDGKWSYDVDKRDVRYPRLNLKVGDDVEARYLGQKWWVKGKIAAVSDDGTFDVVYRDGGTETAVQPQLVRKVARRVAGHLEFVEGDKVDFKFVGMDKWEKATIKKLNGNGTFELIDDSGRELHDISGYFLRRVSTDSDGDRRARKRRDSDEWLQFQVRDKVEARRNGSRVWERGRIKYVHGNGRYDVEFESGDRERYVSAESVRPRSKQSKKKPKKRSKRKKKKKKKSKSRKSKLELQRGDKVEGRFGGREKWYPAKITYCNANGTFDLLYEDGDVERGVKKDLVRAVGDAGRSRSRDRSSSESSTSTSSSRDSSSSSSISNSSSHSDSNSSSGSQSSRSHRKRRSKRRKHRSRSSSGSDEDSTDKFERGDKVEGRFAGKDKWYKAKITACNSNGTFDLLYEDGDVERGVKPEFVRHVGGRSRPNLSVGDKVEANYAGKGKWYKGKITDKHSNGTFDILYEDGDKERGVLAERVRPVGGSSPRNRNKRSKYRVGQAVECRYGGRSQYFKGKVHDVNSDGTYYIKYDNGGEERHAKEDWLKSGGGGRSGSSSDSSSDDDRRNSNSQFRLNERVECNFGGRGKWYKGKIGHINSNNTFDVFYEDGDRERGVKPDRIRSLESSSSGGGSISVGDRVEANFGGRGKWYKGKVTQRHSNGTFDILYEDGDKERGVLAERVRAVGGANNDRGEFKKGDKVEANYAGKGKWYKGEITYKNSNGTYDIRYNDGDKERGVAADRLRHVDGGSSRGNSKYRAGQSIQCRYGGRSQYFKGTIRSVNADGTYFVKYDNGGEEKNVLEAWIKTSSDDSSSSSDSDDDRRNSNSRFRLNERVECNFGGRGKWYKGKIGHINSNNTFDVFYEDGDRERGVKPDRIRSLESPSSSGGSFSVGDAAECNFGGRGKWYAAKVTKTYSNGTYDVLYEDGDRERGVRKENIRAPGASAGGSSFRVGDVVEANFGGKGKWYPGKISMVHSNGTFDILYNDGDKERGVKPENLRSKDSQRSKSDSSSSSSSDSEGDFEEGDEVEGNYASKGRWYKGKIKRVNSNGTYDLLYDDGDTERGVKANNVRLVGGAQKKKKRKKKKKRRGSDSDSSSSDSGGDFEEGDEVEGNYASKGKWYKGKIKRVNGNGTYDLLYDDGDTERGVKANNVRLVGGAKKKKKKKRRGSDSDSSSSDSGGDFEEGDEVEGNYASKGKWYKGKIKRKNGDGSYDLIYDDGDTEKGVRSANVRAVGSTASAARRRRSRRSSGSHGSRSGSDSDRRFSRGDDVEGNFSNKGKWYKAKIEKEYSDGTYKLAYADGDVEDHVDAKRIRLVDEDRDGRRSSRKSPRKHRKKQRRDHDSESGSSSEFSSNVDDSYRGRRSNPRRSRRHRLSSAMSRNMSYVRRVEAELTRKMTQLQQSRLKEVNFRVGCLLIR